MQFRCNICDAANELQPEGFGRDDASCGKCRSTVRLRGLLHALRMEIFGIPLALSEFPEMKSIRGMGMADQMECASLLESRFDYRNTHYHSAPQFDISAPPAERGIFDFILAGDIFEHVLPPARQSLANACALLKPHGFLAMTVPYSPEGTTREHFPELHESGLATVGGRLALVNRTRTGEWQVFDDVVLHGGHGSTVELRLFAERDLRADLASAGFRDVRFASDAYPPFGIAYRESWSLPLIAAKEPFILSRDGVAELARQLVHQREMEAELKRFQGEFEERTQWAMELNAELKRREAAAPGLYEDLNQARFRLAFWEASRWTRLGRALGFGPKLPSP
jgi:SAM-dependent methyltransferase